MKPVIYILAIFAVGGIILFGSSGKSGGQTSSGPLLDERFCADANGDGKLDLSDPITLLNYLFVGNTTPHCMAQELTLCDLCNEHFATRDELEELRASIEALKSPPFLETEGVSVYQAQRHAEWQDLENDQGRKLEITIQTTGRPVYIRVVSIDQENPFEIETIPDEDFTGCGMNQEFVLQITRNNEAVVGGSRYTFDQMRLVGYGVPGSKVMETETVHIVDHGVAGKPGEYIYRVQIRRSAYCSDGSGNEDDYISKVDLRLKNFKLVAFEY